LTLKVEFGFSPSDEPIDYYDISSDIISVSVNRGKDPEQETFNAASCSVQLNNETRNYDPDYGPSPYQGQIVPTGSLRIFSNDQIVFTGLITDWNFSYSPSGESIAEIVATDSFWNLNNQELNAFTPSVESSSDRIISILGRSEVGGTAVWPSTSYKISTGLATLGAYPVTDGTNALGYLQEVEKAEPGRLFINKQGQLVFKSQNDDLDNPTSVYFRTNYSANPSFETNTRNWLPVTGTITRSTATAYIGTASGSLSAGGVVNHFTVMPVGFTFTASLYAKASSGTATVELSALTSTDGTAYTELNPVTQSVTTSGWTRLTTTWFANTAFSGIRVKQSPSSSAVFIDAVLVERSPILDAYFDGSNDPVYNTTDPDAPDYQPQRAFESYETEWLLGS
jgi:hypothetical protein